MSTGCLLSISGCEGLAYALSSKLAEGNICIDIENYKEDLPYLLEKQKPGLAIKTNIRFSGRLQKSLKSSAIRENTLATPQGN